MFVMLRISSNFVQPQLLFTSSKVDKMDFAHIFMSGLFYMP